MLSCVDVYLNQKHLQSRLVLLRAEILRLLSDSTKHLFAKILIIANSTSIVHQDIILVLHTQVSCLQSEHPFLMSWY